MKHILLILTICLLPISLSAGRHTYADQSVLREGKIIKIRVSQTGVHAITYNELKEWGLQPEKVRVLGYGGNMLSENFMQHKWDDLPSVAFYMHKGSDGVFNQGDYILFYAQGAIGWQYAADKWHHTRNPYSDYGYYFLSDSAGQQRLINVSEPLNDEQAYEVDWFTNYQLHEVEKVNLLDKTGVSGGGREFYGEALQGENATLKITFNTPHLFTDMPMMCVAHVAATSTEISQFTLELANKPASVRILGIPSSDFYTKAKHDSILLSTYATGTKTDQQTVTLRYTYRSTSSVGYLNYIELNAPTKLVMHSNQMAISNTHYLNQQYNTRFVLSNATSATQIWRVTDGVNIEQMPATLSQGTLTWVGANQQAEKYVAVNVTATQWLQPTFVSEVKNQNLHALSDKDYVIICPEEFREQAIRLAKKHEEVDHITWAVVTDEEVYNEFSSGTPDVTAYRWLMKMLYDRAQGNAVKQPKNLLLMGNASFDNRKLLRNSGVSRLLVYEAKDSIKETDAYATDDYCGFLEDNAGINNEGQFQDTRAKMNIGVGRLPVRTLEQATEVVDKLCTYMDNKGLGKWKTQICFLADDGDNGLHVNTADNAAEILRIENPAFVVNKIYLDAYTQEKNAAGERYPDAKNRFDNLMKTGVMFMNYSGHGGYNNITNELFMKTQDIRNMTNANQGFWFLATCSFSHFDGGIPSAGEEAVLNPHGGAVGVVSACRTVYASQNKILNDHLCDTLFGHTDAFSYDMTIGRAVSIAKNMTGQTQNKLPYVLLGDPALRLNYPTDYQIQTTTQLDTIRALSVQTVEGYIMTSTGDTAHWFNGPMDITIWDKMQQSITRDNDEPKEANKVKIPFNNYPNTLFAGQTIVENGKFSYTFMVPKDIRYNYGNGRIAYYAYDKESGEEGIGYCEDFVVGGSSTLEIIDTIGPDLRLYINNPAFVDGGKTYEFPHFYAEIYDENGINTVGSGIGHDLLLIVDNDPNQTFVLNDYFTARSNSYQQGTVSFKMPEMTEGAHSITFRAWDLLNNSNTAALNFQVVKGMNPTLYKVLTYPNPVAATGVLNFRIEFDQPDEVVQTEIYLYDLSGRLIKTHKQVGTEGIQWNMNELNATPGMYMYLLKIKTPTSEFVSKAGKIIITQ